MKSILAFAAALAAAPAGAATLIHAYEFDGTGATVAVDSVAGGTNGTLVGGASIVGGALVLDGINDYVRFDTPIFPAGTESFSVYFSFDSHLAQPSFAEVVSQDGGSFYIGSDLGGNFRLSDNIQATPVAFPVNGARHDVLVTADASVPGGQTKLYVDGTLAFTGGLIASSPGAGSLAYIGKQYSCCGEYFQGRVDAVRVFSGVATYAEASGGALAVPEPASWAMLIGGVGMIGGSLRARRRAVRFAAA